MRPLCRQAGQASAEYLGGIVVVAAILAAIGAGGIGAGITDRLEQAVCQVAGTACETGSRDAPAEVVEDEAERLRELLESDPTPEEVAEHFAALDPELARQLALDYPDVVGNLDGAPIELRYAANARAIEQEIERLEAEGVDDDDERLAMLRELDDPDRRFLLFDPEGDGRIAEVFGDLDSAENIAISVPGMDNELNNYSGANAERLQQQGADLGGDVATIQWLGYDTPEGITAATGGPADAGAEDLPGFLDGIRAQRPGDDPHTTVIGHSYGSLVTGKALKDQGLDVDEVVFIGSPGTGVNDADDLGTDAEIWAGRANGDIVGSLPAHGEDPHDVGFGSIRFHTGAISGHSSYFNEGSESLNNMAQIVLGNTDEVDVIE